jgi:hypothetical protein
MSRAGHPGERILFTGRPVGGPTMVDATILPGGRGRVPAAATDRRRRSGGPGRARIDTDRTPPKRGRTRLAGGGPAIGMRG